MANVGGCAVGLLCTPQPCRGTQAVLGPWVTPTAATLGARRVGCCPSPGEGSSLGKGKPERGAALFILMWVGEILKMNIHSIAHF